MIELVTGSLGSGKTYYAVRIIANSVRRGRVVITNVPLVDDWAERLASRGLKKLGNARKVAERADRYRALVYHTESLDEIVRVRVHGDAEGRADLVLDECHKWMNSRQWDQAVGMSKDEAIRQRLKMVQYFTSVRHYGLKVYLITQDERNIDNQVRNLYEYVTRLKNLRRVKVWGVPVMPVNLFVAVRFWNDKVKSRVSVSTYGLDRKIAGLYKTHHLALIDVPEDVIWMPRRNPQPADPPDEGGGGCESAGDRVAA